MLIPVCFYGLAILTLNAIETGKCDTAHDRRGASQIVICKSNRHYVSVGDRDLLSSSAIDASFVDRQPINVKRGLILAKAVRITSIAKPDEDLYTAFCLAEDVHIDDLISAHLLKVNLQEVVSSAPITEQQPPSQWAISIYRKLQSQLENKKIEPIVGLPLLDCTQCTTNHSCCMKRKLMLAMTRKILQWLQDNEAQLQEIDYADES